MAIAQKTLKRLPEQGKITGVCAGFAQYLDIDVTLMRVIFVVLAFATGGLVVLLYFIFVIILPVDETETSTDKKPKTVAIEVTQPRPTVSEKFQNLGHEMQETRGTDRLRNYIGVGLLVLGAWLLLAQFFPGILAFRWDYVWPVLLILVGMLIITRKR